MENIIFGIRPVAEAIQSGRQIERLYIKKDAGGQLMTEFKDLCWRYRVRWQEVPVEKLNRMTRGNHQGVVAQIAAIGYVALQDILDRVPDDETPLIVVFDGVTDVRNFGAIARSAESGCATVPLVDETYPPQASTAAYAKGPSAIPKVSAAVHTPV